MGELEAHEVTTCVPVWPRDPYVETGAIRDRGVGLGDVEEYSCIDASSCCSLMRRGGTKMTRLALKRDSTIPAWWEKPIRARPGEAA
jgi:hypothetical protein